MLPGVWSSRGWLRRLRARAGALRTTRRPRGRAEPLLLAGLVDDDAEIEAFEAALQGALVGAQPDWARRIRVICAAVRAGFSHLSAAASASTSAGVRGVTLAG